MEGEVEFDAIVLAGGRGSRLGGADKAALEVDGVRMLDRALAAVAGAGRVVVVGDPHPTDREVLWAREHPPYGGPVAATYAGLDALVRGSPVRFRGKSGPGTPESHGTTAVVAVLAVDMVGVGAGTVRRVVAAVGSRDGAVLVAGGRRHLTFAVRVAALDRVRPERTEGAAMRDLWVALDLAEVRGTAAEAHDIDGPVDLATMRGPIEDPRG